MLKEGRRGQEKDRKRCARGTEIDLFSRVTEAQADLTLNTQACTGAHTHTRAGSRGIKSHCVRSRSTEGGIKDLRDVI